MKRNFHAKTLPFLAASGGLTALILRLGLYLLATDHKGLLIPGHPLALLTWAVTAAAVVFTVLLVWPLDGSVRYQDNFYPSASAAIGCFALAGGILAAVVTGWDIWSRLNLICSLCGLLAIPAMIRIALCRWQGKRPFFLYYALVCLYLTLYAVSHYQVWSSLPQLQDYFFSMAGTIFLMLFAYYQTAFSAALGRHRMQLATGLLAGFFCLAAVAGMEDVLLYAGGALWALTNLCHPVPVPRKPKPAQEGEAHEAP